VLSPAGGAYQALVLGVLSDVTHVMSRAGVLVFMCKLAGSLRSSALCAFSFQFLLIYNVESAVSLLTTASAAVGAYCLLSGGARRLCRVVQSFTHG
jgi:hypothetical protein